MSKKHFRPNNFLSLILSARLVPSNPLHVDHSLSHCGVEKGAAWCFARARVRVLSLFSSSSLAAVATAKFFSFAVIQRAQSGGGI